MAVSHEIALPEPGERWRKVSARSEGMVVEIVHVTVNRVHFKVINSRSMSQRSGITDSIPVPMFQRDYAPADSPSVLAKREQKRRELRTVSFEVDEPVERPEPAEMARVTVADNGAAFCTCTAYIESMTHAIPGYQCKHLKKVAGDVFPEELLRTRRLDDEQAREVLALKEHESAQEVAYTYGISLGMVQELWSRADAQTKEPKHPVNGMFAQELTCLEERKVESYRKSGRYYSVRTWSNGAVTCTCTDYERNGVACAHVRDHVPSEDVTRVLELSNELDLLEASVRQLEAIESMSTAPAKLRTPPPPTNHEVGEVLGLLADYAETLAQYAGTPFPPLVKLDLEAVRHAVNRARDIVSELP